MREVETIIKGMLRILSVLMIIGTTVIVSAGTSSEQKSLNDALRSYGFKISEELRLENEFKRSNDAATYDTLVASNTVFYVEIEINHPISRKRASNYAKSGYALIQSLYGIQFTPYSGKITNITDCPTERKPESRTIDILGQPTEVLLANATDRHVFGVWTDDLIKTKGAYCVVYDERSKCLLQFKVFQSSSSFDPKTVLGFLESLTRL